MIRSILRYKGSFLLNLLGLTLGFCCFLLALSFVFYERSYDHYPGKRDRICRMATDISSGGVETHVGLSLGLLCDQLPRAFPEIERMVRFQAYSGRTGLRRKAEEPVIPVKTLYYADESVLSVFTYPLTEGDVRTALATPNSIVLTAALKRRLFGSGPALGQTLTENGKPLKVTGVLAELPGNSDLSFDGLVSVKTLKPEDRGDWAYCFILFRSPGAMGAFQHKLDTLTKNQINPQLDPDGNTRFGFVLQPLSTLHYSAPRERDTPKGNPIYVTIFLVTGVLILLIACINSINLSIVKSFSRVMDVTIKKIYGASRARLIGQQVLETLFTGLVAMGLSFVLLWLLLPYFSVMVNRSMVLSDVFNRKVMIAAAGALGLLALGGSLYTGVFLGRVRLAEPLRARTSRVGGLRILPRMMLGFQFFITIGMSIAALSVYRQVHYLRSTPLGYNPDNILVVNLPQNEEAASGDRYLRSTLAGDANVVTTASCAESGLPGKGVDVDVFHYRERGLQVKKTIYHIDVDAHYLAALQIPVIQGSGFPDVGDSAASGNALVTASFVRMAGWKDPLGEVFYNENRKARVIGVIPDFHYGSLHSAIQPMVLFQQVGEPECLLLRVGRSKTAAVLKGLEEHWKKAFPELPFSYSFLDEQLRQQYRDDYNLLSLLLVLTVLMIGISCIGLVAYVSFLLRMARTTIAVRRVIGARFGHIYTLFVRQFVWLLLIAFLAAAPLAWWFADSWLRQFAYHISPRPIDLVIAVVAMGGVVGLIVLRFTLQNVRVNPARVLREN
ncbi:ABC transporter permease [Puia sp.]|jgi:putative ABC transport system permease protein|uniref:ABC transporter permease n=1 Tax=Puia sp. TaxID=2045100 RepID=UPI002F3F3BB0